MNDPNDGAAAEAAYLDRFRKSLKGNMVLKGWITDTLAEGRPSAPFQLVVFAETDDGKPTGLWTWGIAVDPTPPQEPARREMEYSGSRYPTDTAAALDARRQLVAGGLALSDDAPILVGVRLRIRAAARRGGWHTGDDDQCHDAT
jgi:hypothetical protein